MKHKIKEEVSKWIEPIIWWVEGLVLCAKGIKKHWRGVIIYFVCLFLLIKFVIWSIGW